MKRRKTAPRKLATYLTSNSNSPSQMEDEEEEEEREGKENQQDLVQGLMINNRGNLLQQATKLMINHHHHPVNLSSNNKVIKTMITAFNTNFTVIVIVILSLLFDTVNICK